MGYLVRMGWRNSICIHVLRLIGMVVFLREERPRVVMVLIARVGGGYRIMIVLVGAFRVLS